MLFDILSDLISKTINLISIWSVLFSENILKFLQKAILKIILFILLIKSFIFTVIFDFAISYYKSDSNRDSGPNIKYNKIINLYFL